MIDNNETVGVLGAGITGLCIAHSLKKQGIGVSIYERNKQPGGVIHTYRDGGWQIEEGPNTMLVKSQQIWDLLDELNLIGHIVTPGNQDSKRYIVHGGKLCAAPTSFMDFLRSDLLSGRAKFRLLKEPFISASQKEEESIAQFICRRLGKEPLDYAVNPFVSGVYAGDPERLSIRHTFSLLSELEQTYGSITK
jgi:oxygen-dependent protoporphyrinogen oxidase